MSDQKKSVDKLFEALQERAKELNCLYQVEEILREPDASTDEIVKKTVAAIPAGWQYPSLCRVKFSLEDRVWTSPDFSESKWVQTADIVAGDIVFGTISVYYTKEMPGCDEGPFLNGERKLIHIIAGRIGHRIMHQKMRHIVSEWQNGQQDDSSDSLEGWRVVLRMLKQTDRNLYINVARKMLNHLCWGGVAEAERLFQTFMPTEVAINEERPADWNQPHQTRATGFTAELGTDVFKIAADNLSDDEILALIQKWIQEDKLSFLVQVVNRNMSLAEVADAIRRYHHLASEDPEIESPNKRGIGVSLIRRFLSDQLQYIIVAKHFIEVSDFYGLLNRVVFSSDSQGKLGGKSAGLYLARQILKKKAKKIPLLSNVKIPKTYHITSDVLLHFMHYNNFDEVVEQKYKPIDQVRFEYPYIVQTFKSARFPPDIVNGLSAALSDLGDHPLIVRSSSILEDRIGAVFSGKYKSLFVANQGPRRQRLAALLDAVAEVYASTFGPDPIEYRTERGLIDFGEEMGIMIQRVVGSRVGNYFLPSFAGVAFSQNEFRWSPRIKREDGLIRLVPGLGTRAVDRLSDDYPVLIAPGQPGLRVNASPEETARYSPKMIDVINLESNTFETIEINRFLRDVAFEIPGINQMASIYEDGHLRLPSGLSLDPDRDNLAITFEGLITRTPFVKQVGAILNILQETMGVPVDIEFASNGKHFYLLQCRSQSHSDLSAPSPIPKDTPRDKMIFSARKYISNGLVPDITHIVYVNPTAYGELGSRAEMIDVGRAVGKLNKLLPRRQFILMGPGRWGSRGDIRLGVSVIYSDINNTAALIEIARQKGNYVPDLSFGTHFFQDLVEADIRYIPLYPDDDGIAFNEDFLLGQRNILPEVLPKYASLADTIRLIDVPKSTDGQILKVLLNAELGEAVGILTEPSSGPE
ncbi:MAG: PEP/pyruvate-binding domain-containing protein [candidate division Zixibacteria bacterium]|nr:PEP/pyruvate-binding domain-containing protein [candidate division Zixibacteria bacterium]